jgi:putative glutamine amidotransferase
MAERRPLIAIPARFSASASALRYRAEVVAAAVMECVYAAGGEPLAVHPGPEGDSDEAIAARLHWADGVLLPGGGDLSPHWSGQAPHPSLYDVDVRQDAFDLGVARVVLAGDLPLLAVCRGLHAVNVVLGGDLVQDMGETNHFHRRHEVTLDGRRLDVSCYHHQCVGRLGEGLRAVGHAADGVIEAVDLPGRAAWFFGTQWHPEDTGQADPGLFEALVSAAVRPAARPAPRGVGRELAG